MFSGMSLSDSRALCHSKLTNGGKVSVKDICLNRVDADNGETAVHGTRGLSQVGWIVIWVTLSVILVFDFIYLSDPRRYVRMERIAAALVPATVTVPSRATPSEQHPLTFVVGTAV